MSGRRRETRLGWRERKEKERKRKEEEIQGISKEKDKK